MKILVSDSDLMPTKAHPTDAGFDLRAAGRSVINPNVPVKIPTGVRVAIPVGCFGLERLRSGFAGQGVLLASSGVIDADYRGEITVPVVTTGGVYVVEKYERFAQLIILPLVPVELVPVGSRLALGDTDRGEGGFGSTGST